MAWAVSARVTARSSRQARAERVDSAIEDTNSDSDRPRARVFRCKQRPTASSRPTTRAVCRNSSAPPYEVIARDVVPDVYAHLGDASCARVLGPSNSPIFLDQEAFSADARCPIGLLSVDLSS